MTNVYRKTYRQTVTASQQEVILNLWDLGHGVGGIVNEIRENYDWEINTALVARVIKKNRISRTREEVTELRKQNDLSYKKAAACKTKTAWDYK
jgi:predicted transcriptional regulator